MPLWVWMVGGHERGDRGQHRGRLRGVALERLHHQREPRGVGEQPDGDLRFQSALGGEPELDPVIAELEREVIKAEGTTVEDMQDELHRIAGDLGRSAGETRPAAVGRAAGHEIRALLVRSWIRS
jgi:hypothetical protein